MNHVQLEHLKLKEKNRKRMEEETQEIQNQLRETFGYNPIVNLKAVNYKAQNNTINILNKAIEDHIIKEDLQFQPLQKLMQEEKQRIMVEQQGIDLKETIRFFIEKINQYNSILEVSKKKNNGLNLTKLSDRSQFNIYQDFHNQLKTTRESLQNSLKDIKKQILDINFSNSKLKNLDILHENDMKRYTGDDGRITNFHFVLNCHNLVPVFKELQNSSPQAKTLRSKTSTVFSKQKTQYNKQFPSQERKHHLVQKFEEKLDEKLKEIDLIYPIKKCEKKYSTEIEQKDDPKFNSGDNNQNNTFEKMQKTVFQLDQLKQTVQKKKSSIKVSSIPIERRQSVINSKSNQVSPTVIKNMIKETSFLLNKTGTLRNQSVRNSPQKRIKQRRSIKIQEDGKQLRKNRNKLSFELVDQNRTQVVTDLISTNFDKDNVISTILEKDLTYRNNQNDMTNLLGFKKFDDKSKFQETTLVQNENSFTLQSKELLNHFNQIEASTQNIKICELPVLVKEQPEIIEPNQSPFHSNETEIRQKEQKEKQLRETLRRRKLVIEAFSQRKQPKYFRPGGKNLTLPFQLDYVNQSRNDQSLVENIQNDIKMKQRAQEDMLSDLTVLGGPPKKLEFYTTDVRHDYVDIKVTRMVKQSTQVIL